MALLHSIVIKYVYLWLPLSWWVKVCYSCVKKLKDTQNQIGHSKSWCDVWNWLCVPPFMGEAPGPLFGKSCAMGMCVLSGLVSSLLDSSRGVEVFRADV